MEINKLKSFGYPYHNLIGIGNRFDGKGKSAKKRHEELEHLKQEATYQQYIDLCPFVTDK